MKFSIQCTWPGCKRQVTLPAKVWRCKLHEKMAALMAKNAARKADAK